MTDRLLDAYVEQIHSGVHSKWLGDHGREAFAKRVLGVDARAWGRLGEVVDALRRDPTIRASGEVSGFIEVIDYLTSQAFLEGPEAAYSALAKAFARKAAGARRAIGDDNRDRVVQAWAADVAAGRPERGRQSRIAARLKLPARTVSDAVAALRDQGRIGA